MRTSVSPTDGLCRGILRGRRRPARMVHPKAKSLEHWSTSFLSCELRMVFMGVNCLLPYRLPWHESQPDSLALTKVQEQEQKGGCVPSKWRQPPHVACELTRNHAPELWLKSEQNVPPQVRLRPEMDRRDRTRIIRCVCCKPPRSLYPQCKTEPEVNPPSRALQVKVPARSRERLF